MDFIDTKLDDAIFGKMQQEGASNPVCHCKIQGNQTSVDL